MDHTNKTSSRQRRRRYTRVGVESLEPRTLLTVGPAGPEFLVNTWGNGGQHHPAIAMDNAGDFVVTWLSIDQDGSDRGIYAQRYNRVGAPQGGEFRVNT